MKVVELDDISINYKIYGKLSNTIVLISGLGCDHKIWGLLIPSLVQNYKVIVFDNRAIGATKDNNQPFSIEDMSNDCYKLLKYLNISKAHIIGHSMGGSIAMQFAISYPDIVNKLIVINAIPYTPKRLSYIFKNQNNLRRINTLSNTHIVKNFLPWLFSSEFLENQAYTEAFINASIDDTNIQSVDNHLRQVNALIKCDLRNELIRISNQTLIIASKEDVLTPPYLNAEITQYIKNSHIITIPGGHVSQIEYPDVLAQSILNFLI